jgi:hypothetical protein
MKDFFTADDATKQFSIHANFELNNTVPGQLLARKGVKRIGYLINGQSAYSCEYWETVWKDMYDLAKNRCKFDSTMTPPLKCKPPIPPNNESELYETKPYIDYKQAYGKNG